MLPAEEVAVASPAKPSAPAAAAPMAAAGGADAAAAAKAADPAAVKAAFYAKASRVFDELNALFVADPNIDELALVQYAHREYFEGKDVSQFDLTVEGPAFVCLEHKLGVAFWCVPYVLKFAQKLFAAERHRLDDAHTGVTVAANRTFIAAVAAAGGAAGAATAPAPAPAPVAPANGAAAGGAAAAAGGGGIPAASVANLLHATRALLFVNADNYTAWNARKRLLLLGHVSPAQELKLLDLIFSKHPKSGESWAHRRWVLERHPTFQPVLAAAAAAGGDMKRTAAAAVDVYDTATFQAELRACERGAELYPQNYYAWTHRLWLLSLVHTAHHVTTELARCKLWTDTHVSDYASYHYRAYVLMRLAFTSARHHSLAGAVASAAPPTSVAAPTLPAAYFPATPLLRGTRINCGDSHPYDKQQQPKGAAVASVAAAAAVAAVSPVPAPMAHPSLHLTKPPSTQCMTCLIWEQEFAAVDKLLVTFPGHETLYAHRRFVFFFYARLLAQHHMPFVMPNAQPQPPSTGAAVDAKAAPAAAAAASTPVAAGVIAPGDATAVKASWLLPLCERECKWAAARAADATVSDYDKQKRHATAYRLYVLHSAIDLMRCHRSALAPAAGAAATDAAAAALAAVDDALKGLLAQQSAAAKECAACAVVPAHVFDSLSATWHAAP